MQSLSLLKLWLKQSSVRDLQWMCFSSNAIFLSLQGLFCFQFWFGRGGLGVARRAFRKAGMVTHRVCAPIGVIQSGITFGTGSLNCLKPLRLDELHQPALGWAAGPILAWSPAEARFTASCPTHHLPSVCCAGFLQTQWRGGGHWNSSFLPALRKWASKQTACTGIWGHLMHQGYCKAKMLPKSRHSKAPS